MYKVKQNLGRNKEMKRLFSILIVIALVISMFLSGCSEKNNNRQAEDNINIPENLAEDLSTEYQDENAIERPAEPVIIQLDEKDQVVDSNVMFDDKDIDLKFESYDDSSPEYPKLNVMIENNSDHEVKVFIHEGILNGTTFEDIFHVVLPSGKKCFQSINFYLNEIENTKIECSENLEFKFSMYEDDMGSHLFDSDNIIIDFDD
jgi:type III secretory pathway component EscV